MSVTDPTVVDDLRRLVEPATLGSPVQPLRWVSKSREKLARALREMGHKISANTVGKLLTDVLAFSRQVNRKADEGAHHPDRNAQFEHINAKVVAAQAKGEPVISVDTKKKELIGNYKNAGSDYRPAVGRDRQLVHPQIAARVSLGLRPLRMPAAAVPGLGMAEAASAWHLVAPHDTKEAWSLWKGLSDWDLAHALYERLEKEGGEPAGAGNEQME